MFQFEDDAVYFFVYGMFFVFVVCFLYTFLVQKAKKRKLFFTYLCWDFIGFILLCKCLFPYRFSSLIPFGIFNDMSITNSASILVYGAISVGLKFLFLVGSQE